MAALVGTVVLETAGVLLRNQVVPVHLLVKFAALVAMAIFFVLALVRPSGRETTFALRGGSFATSSRRQRYFTVVFLILTGSFVGSAVVDVQEGSASWPGVTLAALWGLIVAMHVVLVWADLPRLELRPEGVKLVSVRSRTVPWESLRPGTPLRGRHNDLHIALTVDRPEMLPPALRKRPIIELGWDAHPWLVADAIRWYVEHPADRPAIGTRAEHGRLSAVLTGTARPAAESTEAELAAAGHDGH